MYSNIIDTEIFHLTQLEFVTRMLVAIGIGLIIGLEREYSAMKEGIRNFAGIRTFVFVVLLGFIGGLTYYLLSPLVYLGLLLAVILLTSISYWVTASRGEIGVTTEFTVFIGFFLGTLTFLGFMEISLMITVVVVVLLSSKFRLHSIVGQITGEELYDFIRFVVIALLVFPFLPNKTVDPFNIINPREVGWVILLTSGLGFVGYMMMKFLGARRGILLSGIVGGLVSSTAVTWVFAKKSKENEGISQSCAIAILAASSIMIIRVLVWTFLFNKLLFTKIYLAIAVVFLAGMGVTLFLYFKQSDKEKIATNIRQNKPLDLTGALVFGVIYTVVLLVVSYANEYLGAKGMLISSAIAGLSDIDAITITVSKMAGLNLDFSIASKAVLIATVSNTIIKMGIGIWAGSPSLRKYLFAGYLAIIITAVLVLPLLNG